MAKMIVSLSVADEKNEKLKALLFQKVQEMGQVIVFYQSFLKEDDKNLLFLSGLEDNIGKIFPFQTISSSRITDELKGEKNVIVISRHIPLNLHIQENMEEHFSEKLLSLGMKKNSSLFTSNLEFSIENLGENREEILKLSKSGDPYFILF